MAEQTSLLQDTEANLINFKKLNSEMAENLNNLKKNQSVKAEDKKLQKQELNMKQLQNDLEIFQ